MTSIGRTAYPRFRRAAPARELHESCTPGAEEIVWAREQTRSPQGLLTLLALLKSFQRLGCFPDLFEVPVCVVDHVRRAVGLPTTIELVTETAADLGRVPAAAGPMLVGPGARHSRGQRR